jgi:hypothetical protein
MAFVAIKMSSRMRGQGGEGSRPRNPSFPKPGVSVNRRRKYTWGWGTFL